MIRSGLSVRVFFNCLLGVTLESLWLRLGGRVPEFPLRLDAKCKAYLWRLVSCHKDVLIYELPKPRQTVMLLDRFKNTDPSTGIFLEQVRFCEGLLVLHIFPSAFSKIYIIYLIMVSLGNGFIPIYHDQLQYIKRFIDPHHCTVALSPGFDWIWSYDMLIYFLSGPVFLKISNTKIRLLHI